MCYALFALFGLSCNAQQNEAGNSETNKIAKSKLEQPKGDWKVDKAYDKNGNLIRYDSIYSWSSHDNLDSLSTMATDSLLMAVRSRFFQNFSDFNHQGFPEFFSEDSLFNKRFLSDDFFGTDFGKDVMDIDKMRQHMIERQKQFLEKYQKEFIKPEEQD